MSSLERCPLFRVSLIERFQCSAQAHTCTNDVNTIASHMVRTGPALPT